MAEDPYAQIAKPIDDPYAAIATPVAPAPAEKPGLVTRFAQTVGIPTSKEELGRLVDPAQTGPIPVGSGLGMAVNYGKNLYQKTKAAIDQPSPKSAMQAAFAVTPGGAAQQSFGEDVASKNYAGAAGTALGVGAQFVAPELIRRGADAMPSAARAGAALQDIKATVGDVPINTAKVGDAALELYTQSNRGATLPPAVNKLVRRMTAPNSPPLTYEEAKDFQSNISSLSANEKMNLKPNQVRLVGQLNSELKASLADAADVAGKGEQFKDAMREYHYAMKAKGWTDAAISNGWKVALGALGAREVAKILGIGER